MSLDNEKAQDGFLAKYLPNNFQNPIRLLFNLIRSNNAVSYYAIIYLILGVLFSPLDRLLQKNEQRRYRNAPAGRLPIIFVCGAPRSGTTLTTLLLIKYLPVFYFNNFSSLFPRSPITALTWFRKFFKKQNQHLELKSFYGRTAKLWQPNDALYFWDRWTGSNRIKVPKALEESKLLEMKQFFNAVEEFSGRPLLNKNNQLGTFAHLVARNLPNSCFIYVDRDPVFVAQSQLVARRFINGDKRIPYGVRFEQSTTADYLTDVCNQTLAFQSLMKEQQALIGADRFLVVNYRDLCNDPAKHLQMVAQKFLEIDLPEQTLNQLKPIPSANRIKIDQEDFARLKSIMDILLKAEQSAHQ